MLEFSSELGYLGRLESLAVVGGTRSSETDGHYIIANRLGSLNLDSSSRHSVAARVRIQPQPNPSICAISAVHAPTGPERSEAAAGTCLAHALVVDVFLFAPSKRSTRRRQEDRCLSLHCLIVASFISLVIVIETRPRLSPRSWNIFACRQTVTCLASCDHPPDDAPGNLVAFFPVDDLGQPGTARKTKTCAEKRYAV